MIHQTRQQTKHCLGLSSHSSKKWNINNNEEDEAAIEKMRKEIEANQENAVSLCTEKVLLAKQAYDLVSLPSPVYQMPFLFFIAKFKLPKELYFN